MINRVSSLPFLGLVNIMCAKQIYLYEIDTKKFSKIHNNSHEVIPSNAALSPELDSAFVLFSKINLYRSFLVI